MLSPKPSTHARSVVLLFLASVHHPSKIVMGLFSERVSVLCSRVRGQVHILMGEMQVLIRVL